ncbi:uncharacterized protein EV420DRAFT_241746 [Desarmillaria tabescens]|uniref:Uncharacterized protein n=1 Tax=Armillaria tabescens TaxID=1929756 RepID=A0AA39MJS7_ARMTA|nr:uncharacterized protein EV420DRAFT_241746 [Desarmillaria tabescens]KAK0436294.1 hypothetical protein EV420DRAFT_241746 [Desarmillaria tabescens]
MLVLCRSQPIPSRRSSLLPYPPPMTLATPQERVIFTILSTGAITGLAIVTVLVALLFLLNLTTNRPGVSKMSWTDILDSLPSQPIFFVCLIVNDAVYQRVRERRRWKEVQRESGYMKYIGIPLVGSVGFTTYSITREQARDVERASAKT